MQSLVSRSRVLCAALLALLAACGPSTTTPDGGDAPDEDAGAPPLVSGFAADAAVDGPRVVVSAEDVTDEGAVLVVRAHALGAVWGLALHVDVGALAPPAVSDIALAGALGGALSAEEHARVRTTPAGTHAIELVSARAARDEGVAIDDTASGVELARFPVGRAEGETGDIVVDVAPRRAFVRRASGEVVVPARLGGRLTLAGGAL